MVHAVYTNDPGGALYAIELPEGSGKTRDTVPDRLEARVRQEPETPWWKRVGENIEKASKAVETGIKQARDLFARPRCVSFTSSHLMCARSHVRPPRCLAYAGR